MEPHVGSRRPCDCRGQHGTRGTFDVAIDLSICGHDHNRQWLEPTCGTELIVSGTAAKTTGLEGRGTPTFFEDDVDGGFLLVEIDGNTLTGWFYDDNAQEEFSRTITK